MKTNNLKKGDRVLLAYGEKNRDLASLDNFHFAIDTKFCKGLGYKPWEAEIFDNLKGDIRYCLVEGFETEYGSVYAHDIIAVLNAECNWEEIEHTKSQLQMRENVKKLMK